MTIETKVASTPYSVRLPEDIKGKLMATLSASGYTAPEFFDRMVNSFQLQEGNKPTRPEITEVTRAIKRIQEAMESLSVVVENTEADKLELSRNYASESEVVANELIIANQQTAEVQQALIQSQRDMETLKADNDKTLAIMQKEIDRLKLVEDLITEIRQESKEAKMSLKVAVADRDEARTITEATVKTSKDLQSQVDELQNTINSLQQQSEKVLTEVATITAEKSALSEEVITLRNQLEAEKQINKERVQQSHIDQQQAVLSAKEDAMLKREQLQNELMDLKAQLAKSEVKKTPKAPKVTASTEQTK